MYYFGIELEGFYLRDGVVSIPPKTLPLDGFPGIVELRTTGPNTLEDSCWGIFREKTEMKSHSEVSFGLNQHKFTPQERSKILSRVEIKGGTPVMNIYGKAPRDLRGVTTTSCQINISMMTKGYTTTSAKGESLTVTDSYKMFDFPTVIKELDRIFGDEISESKRQPGCYAIKDFGQRVEYRSLPSSAFPLYASGIPEFIQKIRSAFSEE